jgi:hypothetical protein
MADETTTGAAKEVSVDTSKVEQRKKIIKYVVIAAVIGIAAYLIYKYVI